MSVTHITDPRFDTGVYAACTLHTLNSITQTQITSKIDIRMLNTHVAVKNKDMYFAFTISHELLWQLNTS